MKTCLRLPFILAILTCQLWLPAQHDSLAKAPVKKHELGMNLYTLTGRSGDFYSQYRPRLYNYVFNGVYYKASFGRHVLRFGLNYYQKLITYQQSYLSTAPNSHGVQLAAGYQHLLGRKKTAPFIKADLSYEHLVESRVRNYYDIYPYSSYLAPMYNEYYSARSNVFNLSPGIGLRTHLGSNITLTIESGVDLFYSVENQLYKSVGMNVRPLQLYFGFIF